MEKNEVTHALSLIYSDEQTPWVMTGVLYTGFGSVKSIWFMWFLGILERTWNLSWL